MKALSVAGLLLMIGGMLGLIALHSLFSPAPLVVIAQAGSFALMVWARITFGRRSFHATADPTEGGIVTTGPYRFVRHPIYTAICLFAFAGTLAHTSLLAAGLAVLVFAGALVRMLAEEQFLSKQYPEYARYTATTKRMLPCIF